MIHFALEQHADHCRLLIRPGNILSGNNNLSRDSHLHQLVTYSGLVVMDFNQVMFMDFSALQQILSLRDWAWQQALDFHIINASGQVQELLDAMDVQQEYWSGVFHENVPSTIQVL